ncbi:Glycosyltransferase involved in cell wall bisynthesis [Halopenitus malekzadehii]|uniref:Glycosyltransferase involved in cell wall bisynthesis n=1 Tax=Halopenitus malekzadehii TaxID=1267564 RepID=A0A1H6IAM9_9EURY|nr:glycosyltransferase [Halopenitus malekzadehii]SEH46306.1 Glycosyltransferase involved in cell wall bisynthesis [Halopenitus malekzadehii]
MSDRANYDEARVLFITKADLAGTEGHNVATKEIAIALCDHTDIETTVLCPEPSKQYATDLAEAVDDFIHFTSTDINIDGVRHVLSFLRLSQALRATLDDIDPDLIIARMAPLLIAPAFFASRRNVPYVLLSRGYHYKTLRFSSLLTRVYQYNVRIADQVYTASEEIKQDTDQLRSSDQKGAVVLFNAVNTDRFRPISKMGTRKEINTDLGESSFVVGFVGTMKSYHALPELFEAVNDLGRCDVEILVVGDGPRLGDFRSTAQDLGIIDRIHFTGYVPHDEVYRYISACDVMYGVSHQGSATPIKCFEYLACERPLIVQNVDDMTFVADRDIGQLVDSVSSENIATAIEMLAELDDSELEAMGQRGREYVLRNHTWKGFADTIVERSLKSK